MKAPVLEVNSLVKNYGPPAGGFTAVGGVSFVLRPGEALGLLGPNGAGKTTTIQMLLGLTEPTMGKISYFGRDFRTNREWCMSRINFVSAYNQLQTRNTVRQNLHVFAISYNVANWQAKIDEYSNLMGITDKLDTQYWKLSSGERARANFVKALINEPDIILMDEPTASLDPEIVATVIATINDIRKKGVAILFTSHNMQEVSRVCDRVMFMDHGKIVASDTPLGLSKKIGTAILRLVFEGKKSVVEDYAKEKKYTYSFPYPSTVELRLGEEDVPKVLFDLSKLGMWITDIEVDKPTLEDVFLKIAKGGKHAFV
jgi:ABC-2 type transport system ATP-binding protein